MVIIVSRAVKRYFRYGLCALAVVVFVPVIIQRTSKTSHGGLIDLRPTEDRAHGPPGPIEVEIPDLPGFNQAASLLKREHYLPDGDSRKIFGFDPKNLAKKDWTNFTQVELEKQRKGPGEHGLPYRKPDENKKEKDALYRVNGFNAMASDDVALTRSIKDIRPKGCKSKLYLEKLPTVSVVLPFHNEHWSTLLRSVYSIVDRSPKELLKEVILADDFSTKEFLGEKLDKYVAEHWPNGLVKVVRATKREGLIRARLLGARPATGQVIIFLDSHSECGTNWLPPLLEPIAYNYRTVVCPFVDVVDYETFEYRAQDEGGRGAWDWELYYKRLPLLPEDKLDLTKPFKSPVMAGGYFAISTKWFWELGGYDEGLDIWGGEQYELSFKLWQCGGEMVDVACSHVGHIYRKYAPFTNAGVGDFIGRNYKRVAEVWMDEYKEHLYNRRPHYRTLDAGDLTKQKALREKLKCKSFKWFMENVAFDQPEKYPAVEPENGASGEIRNKAANLCIDTRFKGADQRFELQPCVKDNPDKNMGEQNFEMTWHKDIRPHKRNICFDVSRSNEHAPVVLFACHGSQGNQQWKYRIEEKQLYHPVSAKCMDCDPDNREIFMSKCDPVKKSQKWEFEHMNVTLIRRWGQNVK